MEPETRRCFDGRLRRRWFTDDDMDLFLWFDEEGEMQRLQLCYAKRAGERVLSWRAREGFRHDRIDAGDDLPGERRSPIFVADGRCDVERVLADFRDRSLRLPDALFDLVYARLLTLKWGSRSA